MVSMGSQRGGVEGSRVSLLRCLGRFRGQEGVLLVSYLRCLGRFGGSKRCVFEGSRGSPFRVLKVGARLDGFGRFWTVLGGFGRFWPLPWGPMVSLHAR